MNRFKLQYYKIININPNKRLLYVIILITLTELGIIPQRKTGFYCNDISLSFEYTGDTISMTLLLSTIPLAFFFIWITEIIYYEPKIKQSQFKTTIISSLIVFREYFIGMIFNIICLEILKLLFGELRPHFFDTCKPDTSINCTSGTFIKTYECTNKKISGFSLADTGKSFPSGHASVTSFEAVFMIWYLQHRSPNLKSKLLLPFIQCCFFAWSALVSLSRITDRRHHWWDVVCGAILGIVFAWLTCSILSRNFSRSTVKNQNSYQNGGHTLLKSNKEDYPLNSVTNT